MNVHRLQHLTLLAALVFVSPATLAAQYDGYAQVRRVTPQYEQVNIPRQECRSEYIQPSPSGPGDSYTGSVIGGITGAIVGNQVGRGNGNVVATALGAITGAIVGGRLQNRSDGNWGGREVRRCRTRDQWERRLVGYRVVYEYAGHQYTALLPNDPGNTLRVRVSVEPY